MNQEVAAAAGQRAVLSDAPPHVANGGQRVAVEADHIVGPQKEVQLRRLQSLGAGMEADALADDEEVLAIVVDLGGVDVRVQAVVNGQVMEVEDVL